jgi:signal transduction histidine kinase
LALERVRAHLAADLHDDLGAGLTEIAILTEVAREDGNRKGLEVVAQRARELRASMDDIVWSVDPECDNLEELIRRWRHTAFALLGNEAMEFTAPEASEMARIELTPDRRRQLLLFFKEVVTNVARHAVAERVWIEVRLTPGWLHLEVRDDGCGFAPGRVTDGNGLKNMATRAESLAGVLKLDSSPGGGTTVRLNLPLRAA